MFPKEAKWYFKGDFSGEADPEILYKVLLPDIEPIYMSDKNSNHVKEIDDI